MTGVLIRRGEAHRDTGGGLGGGDWRDASPSQGTARAAGAPAAGGEAGNRAALRAARRGRPAHLDCGLWPLGLESECLWFQASPRGPLRPWGVSPISGACRPPSPLQSRLPFPPVERGPVLPQVPDCQSCPRAHDFLGRREGRPTELRRIVSGGAVRPLRGHLACQGPPGSGRLHHRPGAYLPISDSGPGCPSLFLPRPASQADSGRLRGTQRRPQAQPGFRQQPQPTSGGCF